MDAYSDEKNDSLIMESKRMKDTAFENEAVCRHMGLVKSVATRFLGRGVEFDDLVQLGCIGLIKAIRNYDPTTENAFSTYAVPLIMGEIRRFFRDNGPVKISRKIQSDHRTVQKYMDGYERQYHREPRLDEIVQGTGLDYEEVVLAIHAKAATVSLTPDEDGNVIEIRDAIAEGCFMRIELLDAIETLSKDEKTLLYLRYIRGFTQCKTADILKSNQVKISRMEKKLKEKLKIVLDVQS